MCMSFESGEAFSPSHRLRVVSRSNAAFLFPILVERWCKDNCKGRWHIEQEGQLNSVVDLNFSDLADFIMFKLSSYHSNILAEIA